MSRYFKKGQSGFTLVEVLVSLIIMLVILSVILFDQEKYNDGAAVTNLADHLGLTIAQAQSYGTSVREANPGSSDFSGAYGVSLATFLDESKVAYMFFTDRNQNQAYDGSWDCVTGPAEECLERVELSGGNLVDDICVVRNNDTDQCNNAKRVDIVFTRPRTDAQLTFYNGNGNEFSPGNMKGVRVKLISPGGVSRSVVVYTSGQVSIQ